ncbi:hypothetical protein HDU83_002010 [Entophlyctis luteolus]|nr:hypothetical protein HDU83_002010 [Entophlyctis luteolus]
MDLDIPVVLPPDDNAPPSSIGSVPEDTDIHRTARPQKADSKYAVFGGVYLLIRTIGQGEFGKVKLAVHTETQRQAAVKLTKKSLLNADRKERLMREISIMQSLDHPYILKLLDVIETDYYIGLVMEPCLGMSKPFVYELQCLAQTINTGGELFDYIVRRNFLPEANAVRFFAQIIVGVSYLHSMGIVHRDLKLENILLDEHENIVIADFGFASQTVRNNSDLLVTSCGSPAYAAPELVLKDSYSGVAADIWSCGVILYSMLAGYLPFDDDPANPDGANIHLLYQYIMSAKPNYPETFSENAKELIGMMLVTDPDQRASLAQVMGHIWLSPAVDIFEAELERRQKDIERKLQDIDVMASDDAAVPISPSLSEVGDIRNPQAITAQEHMSSRISSEQLMVDDAKLEKLLASAEKLSVAVSAGGDDDDEDDASRRRDSVDTAAIGDATPVRMASVVGAVRTVRFSPESSNGRSRSGDGDAVVNEEAAVRKRQSAANSLGPPDMSSRVSSNLTVVSLSASDYNVRNGRSGASGSNTAAGGKVSRRIRVHTNRMLVEAIDKRAVSMRDVDALFVDIGTALTDLGLEIIDYGNKTGEYKMKVVQPGMIAAAGSSNSDGKFGGGISGVIVDLKALARISSDLQIICEGLEESLDSAERVLLDSSTAKSLSKAIKNKGQAGGIFPAWVSKKFQYMSNYGLHYNKGHTTSEHASRPTTKASLLQPVVKPGVPSKLVQFIDEISFEVEIFKVKSLPGKSVVEFKRIRGDIWEFKNLYNRVIGELPLLKEY